MIKVLYEDNHLLVVDKPAGLLTQPSGTDEDSLESQCKQWIKERDNKPGNVYLHAVHRLDKPVSGIVVFAKTSKALSRLNESIREQKVKKWYTAMTELAPETDEGTLQHYLTHDEHRASVEKIRDKTAKLAILHYRVLELKKEGTILEIRLETGRYHQIRAQLAEAGCSIIGDKKYGACSNYLPDAIALHHHRFEIPHPVSGEILQFTSEVPFRSHLR